MSIGTCPLPRALPPLLEEPVVLVPFGNRAYYASEWLPGTAGPFQGLPAVALDTETKLIVPGDPIVPVVLQVAASGSDKVAMVRAEHFQAFLEALDAACPRAFWVFFNAPFDAKVLGWPGELLWRIFSEGRMVDMAVRGVLAKLAQGTFMDRMNLAMFTWDVCRVKLSKDESVRLAFEPGETLSPDKAVYAAMDAVATINTWEAYPETYPTEELNLKGAFALSAISDQGILLDEERRTYFDEELAKVQLSQWQILKLFGIAPSMAEIDEGRKRSGMGRRKQWLLQAMERQYGVKLRRSPKSGGIIADKQTLDLQLIMNGIPVPTWLDSMRKFDHARKMRGSYLAANMAGTDGKAHARFTTMVKTGRTACSKPPLQQYPRDPLVGVDGRPIGEIRSIWLPTPGYAMLATDYNQLELCALAESCYRRFGRSVMGDLINADVDVHLWFGGVVGSRKGMDFDPDDKKHPVTADLRQRAKAADFGIPGGLGAATFVAYARNYGVDLDLDEAKELIEMWLDSFPEMREHLEHPVDEYWTLQNIRSFLTARGMEAPGVRTVQDLEYFLMDRGWQPEDARKATSGLTMYMVTTLTGRTKRNCTYCSAANMEFQAPASDGGKLALWEGYIRAWRMVDFIHDEILQEVSLEMRLPERTEFIRGAESVMVSAMSEVLPRMKIKVESTLSMRWLKGAKHVEDSDGNLLIWEPESHDAVSKIERKLS